MKTDKERMSLVLILLHIYLAIGAIFGGLAFIIQPSGKFMGLPVSLLWNSPFKSYLIPGIILLVVFGIFPAITICGLIRKSPSALFEQFNLFKDKHWSWTFSLYIGFALIIWITIQVHIIRTLSMLQFIYVFLGLAIQIVTLLPKTQAKHELSDKP